MKTTCKVRGVALWFTALTILGLFGLCVWQHQALRRLKADAKTANYPLVLAFSTGYLPNTSIKRRIIFARGVR